MLKYGYTINDLVKISATILLFACIPACKQKTIKAAVVKNTYSTAQNSFTKIKDEIKSSKKLLEDGDLVTRSDDDFESLTLMNFSQKEKSYSHSGIVFKEDSDYYVYHSMTGAENPEGLCRRDPFDSFVNPLKKTGFGIFKYQLSLAETDRLHTFFKKNHAAKIPFDIYFNLATDDSMYCSELIYKGLKEATGGRVILPTTVIKNYRPKILGHRYNNRFFKTFEYIAIDDLYLNRFCKEIKRVKY